MTNDEFAAAIGAIEEGSEGAGYHLNVTLACGKQIEGPWGAIPGPFSLATHGLFLIHPNDAESETTPTIIAISAVVALHGNFLP